jgi:hypothetical protein
MLLLLLLLLLLLPVVLPAALTACVPSAAHECQQRAPGQLHPPCCHQARAAPSPVAVLQLGPARMMQVAVLLLLTPVGKRERWQALLLRACDVSVLPAALAAACACR